jgi:hypothetical protein
MPWQLNNRAISLIDQAVQEGRKIANDKDAQLNQQASQHEIEKNRALAAAKRNSGKSATTAECEFLTAKLHKVEMEKIKAEAMLEEWITSSEAYKRLAVKYSRAANVPPEELDSDAHEEILNVKEERSQAIRNEIDADIQKNRADYEKQVKEYSANPNESKLTGPPRYNDSAEQDKKAMELADRRLELRRLELTAEAAKKSQSPTNISANAIIQGDEPAHTTSGENDKRPKKKSWLFG